MLKFENLNAFVCEVLGVVGHVTSPGWLCSGRWGAARPYGADEHPRREWQGRGPLVHTEQMRGVRMNGRLATTVVLFYSFY
jgi:hypothetical protein